jgi:hypothetical protein
MGNENSKNNAGDVKQIGDQQVTVIENQSVHTEYHVQHDVKLWVIIVMVTILLAAKIAKAIFKLCKRQAKKAVLQTV